MVRFLLCGLVVGCLVLTVVVSDSGPAVRDDPAATDLVGVQHEAVLIEMPGRGEQLQADTMPAAQSSKTSALPVPAAAPAQVETTARAGDEARARTHPHEYVGGNPWWPRRRLRTRERNADPLVAAPVSYGASPVALVDDGVHRRAKDVGEKRLWLDARVASGDDHQFGGVRAAAVAPPGAPVRKVPERRLAVDLTVRTNVSGAVVRANGYDVPSGTLSMTLRIPGDLMIEATAPGYARLVRMIRLGEDFEGGALPVALEMQPDTETPPPADAGVANSGDK